MNANLPVKQTEFKLTAAQLKKVQKTINKAFSQELKCADILGSCQYRSIEETILLMQKLGNMGIPFELRAHMLGYKITKPRVHLDSDIAVKAFCDDLKAEIKGYLEQDPDDEYDLRNLETLNTNPPTTIGQCFDLMRNMSWDLWAAIPEIFGHCFPNFEVDETKQAIKDKSVGPTLNMMNWDSNVELGIKATLLMETYPGLLMQDMADFDT